MKDKKKITYLYICEDDNCRLFATFGNFKTGWNYPAARYEIRSEDDLTTDKKKYWIPTLFNGYIRNISCGRLPEEFSVIYQIPYEKHYRDLVKLGKYIVSTYIVDPERGCDDFKGCYGITDSEVDQLKADLKKYNDIRTLDGLRPLSYKG